MLAFLSHFLMAVGAYALALFLYENLRSPLQIICAYLRENYCPRKAPTLKERFGDWAAITGASDGIGKEYARSLARKGINVVLISRNKEKLEKIASDIENEFRVQTKIVVVDFTEGDHIYTTIESELNKIPIGILVNNVGANTPRIGSHSSFTHKEISDVICTNIIPVTQLSRYFMHRMQKENIKGCIVNVSSLLEIWQAKNAALYPATKAFTRSLTMSLQLEAKQHGITVQLVSPSFVATKINSYSSMVMRGTWYIPQADTYAKWAVETIGVTDITSGYHVHGIKHALSKLAPWQLRARLIDLFMLIFVDK